MRYSVIPIATDPSWLETIPFVDFLSNFHQVKACAACQTETKKIPAIRIGGQASSEKTLELAICSNCGHVSYSQLPGSSWLSKFYLENWDKYGREVRPVEDIKPQKSFDHLLALNLPKDVKILDFGAGFGSDLMGLKELGYRNLHGVEPSAHRFAHLNKLGIAKVKHGSLDEAEDLHKKVGDFDLIVSRHVVEHLIDPFSALKRLVGLLRPGGRIIFLVPNVYTESPIATALFLPHLHLFNRTSMMRMMACAGLRPYSFKPSEKRELIILGLKAPATPPEASEYTGEEIEITDDYLKGLQGFLQTPWSTETNQGKTIFWSYTHPTKTPGIPLGLKKISRGPLSLILLAHKVAKNMNWRSQIRAMHRACKATRLLFGNETLVSNNIIGFQPIPDASSSIKTPWIVTPKGDIPILIK